jgi:hypothetical protein
MMAAARVRMGDSVVVVDSDEEDEAGFWAVMARTTPIGKGGQGSRQGVEGTEQAAGAVTGSGMDEAGGEGLRSVGLWQEEPPDNQQRQQQQAATPEAVGGSQLLGPASSSSFGIHVVTTGTSLGAAPTPPAAAALEAGGCSDTGLLASEGGVWPEDDLQQRYQYQQDEQQQQQQLHGEVRSPDPSRYGVGTRWGQARQDGLSPHSMPLLASASPPYTDASFKLLANGGHGLVAAPLGQPATTTITASAAAGAAASRTSPVEAEAATRADCEVGRVSRGYEMPWQMLGEWSSVSSIAGSCVIEAREVIGSQQTLATAPPTATAAAMAVAGEASQMFLPSPAAASSAGLNQHSAMGRAPGGVSVTAAWEGAAARASFNQGFHAGLNTGAEEGTPAGAIAAAVAGAAAAWADGCLGSTAVGGVNMGSQLALGAETGVGMGGHMGPAVPSGSQGIGSCSLSAAGLLACVEDSRLLLALSAKLEHLAQRFRPGGSSGLEQEHLQEACLGEVQGSSYGRVTGKTQVQFLVVSLPFLIQTLLRSVLSMVHIGNI